MPKYNNDEADIEIFKNGQPLAMIDLNKERMEDFIRVLRWKSGSHVDWSYFGGRAVIKYLGERTPVEAAFKELLPFLGMLQAARLLRDFSWEVNTIEPSFAWL